MKILKAVKKIPGGRMVVLLLLGASLNPAAAFVMKNMLAYRLTMVYND